MSKPFNYGGQAVIEGVMMRGRKHMAVAVRKPDGEIVLHTEPLNPRIYSSFINKVPFLRGFTLLWDALVLGMRTLMFSADVAMGEEDVEFSGPIAWGTVALSLVLAVAIFFVSPLGLISLATRLVEIPILVQHLIEGVFRLGLFLIYVWAIGHLNDVRRVFGYHGAEHKAINAYEQGVELTPEKVAACSIVHPRCGTAFLLLVMVISIFVFALVGDPALWLKIASRIVLIPVIAGIAYEFLKFSAAHQNNPIIKLLIAPGLALQGMTTREPDLGMLEVSIAALQRLLVEEKLAAEAIITETVEPLPA
ncbi:MAG TPA: DUF1385 domain-containing protein, partial [Anaerolineae bacterium]|nr:DUF1385 domain-containing protein [Anaerolineae bacterium]